MPFEFRRIYRIHIDNFDLCVLLVGLGDKVSEADGGEGDEAKVERVQEAPALPSAEQKGT